MPSSESSERGSVGEQSAARKYGLEGLDEQTGYYDLRRPVDGRRYQVKSCTHTRASGNVGKFRFWKDHLTRLDSEGGGVVLVLTASGNSSHVLKTEKVETAEVLEVVADRWYPSGHADEGEQYKVPWPDLLTY